MTAPYHGRVRFFLSLLLLLPLQLLNSSSLHAATSSNDIYEVLEIADRAMDVVLLKAKGVSRVATPAINESQLTAMHAYQLHIACLDQLRLLEVKLKLRPFPKIVASPASYQAEDVAQLSAIILAEVRRIAIHLNIWGMPELNQNYRTKSYNDVVGRCLAVFMKLRALGDMGAMSLPNVFPEFPRCVADIKSILTHIDPAQRYRIDVTPSSASADLATVYQECLLLRHDLNKVRRFYKLKEVAVPKGPPRNKVGAGDIFIQSQIILAELNALKKVSNTSSISPEAIPSPGKTATDLLDQVRLLRYLAPQIPSLRDMVQ